MDSKVVTPVTKILRPKKHSFLEMIQLYLDFKKINASVIKNEDGFLQFDIDFETPDYKLLPDLLAHCIPISYVINNTASSDYHNDNIVAAKAFAAEKSSPKSKPKEVEISSYMITDLVIDYRAKEWCKLPYKPFKDKNGRLKRDRKGNIKYQYHDGCPNYNKKPFCPPFSDKIEDFINIAATMFFMVAKFNLKGHFDEKKILHPDWSDIQCRNSRHWQNSVVSQLNKACIKFIEKSGMVGMVYDLKPESLGVNVFKSMKNLDIILEKRPKNFVHKIAIIGFPKTNKDNKKVSNQDLAYYIELN